MTIDTEAEFKRIRLSRLEARDRWGVIRDECPCRTDPPKGLVGLTAAITRCNHRGDPERLNYCLFGACPKI